MVTIKQIADAVGVSSATVSRVLNFDSTLSVSAQTRKSIVETAEALNYATPRNRNQGLDKRSRWCIFCARTKSWWTPIMSASGWASKAAAMS